MTKQATNSPPPQTYSFCNQDFSPCRLGVISGVAILALSCLVAGISIYCQNLEWGYVGLPLMAAGSGILIILLYYLSMLRSQKTQSREVASGTQQLLQEPTDEKASLGSAAEPVDVISSPKAKTSSLDSVSPASGIPLPMATPARDAPPAIYPTASESLFSPEKQQGDDVSIRLEQSGNFVWINCSLDFLKLSARVMPENRFLIYFRNGKKQHLLSNEKTAEYPGVDSEVISLAEIDAAAAKSLVSRSSQAANNELGHLEHVDGLTSP